HVVEENVEIERQRLRHAVLAMVGREIVVPLPGFAVEGRLHVDLHLLGVKSLAEELERQFEEAQMKRHRCAYLPACLLADVGERILRDCSIEGRTQDRHLVCRKEARQHEKAIASEISELSFAQFHRCLRNDGPLHRGCNSPPRTLLIGIANCHNVTSSEEAHSAVSKDGLQAEHRPFVSSPFQFGKAIFPAPLTWVSRSGGLPWTVMAPAPEILATTLR